MAKWPLTGNLPEPKFKPLVSMLPARSGYMGSYHRRQEFQRAVNDAQLQAWREATGLEHPQRIEGLLMPLDEAQQVMRALGRKTLPIQAEQLVL